jgi:hypothetical protein
MSTPYNTQSGLLAHLMNREPLRIEFSNVGLHPCWNWDTADPLALGFRPGHPRLDPFADERAFELCRRRHDGEDHFTLWRGGIDILSIGDEVHAQAEAARARTGLRPLEQ